MALPIDRGAVYDRDEQFPNNNDYSHGRHT